MNILVVDALEMLSAKQKTYAKNRVFYSLCRFQHKINGATLHFHYDDDSRVFNCTANVNVEGQGIVTVRKNADSFAACLTKAVDALEPKIASSFGWKNWPGAEVVSSSFEVVGEFLGRISRSHHSPAGPDAKKGTPVQRFKATAKSRQIT